MARTTPRSAAAVPSGHRGRSGSAPHLRRAQLGRDPNLAFPVDRGRSLAARREPRHAVRRPRHPAVTVELDRARGDDLVRACASLGFACRRSVAVAPAPQERRAKGPQGPPHLDIGGLHRETTLFAFVKRTHREFASECVATLARPGERLARVPRPRPGSGAWVTTSLTSTPRRCRSCATSSPSRASEDQNAMSTSACSTLASRPGAATAQPRELDTARARPKGGLAVCRHRRCDSARHARAGAEPAGSATSYDEANQRPRGRPKPLCAVFPLRTEGQCIRSSYSSGGRARRIRCPWCRAPRGSPAAPEIHARSPRPSDTATRPRRYQSPFRSASRHRCCSRTSATGGD